MSHESFFIYVYYSRPPIYIIIRHFKLCQYASHWGSLGITGCHFNLSCDKGLLAGLAGSSISTMISIEMYHWSDDNFQILLSGSSRDSFKGYSLSLKGAFCGPKKSLWNFKSLRFIFQVVFFSLLVFTASHSLPWPEYQSESYDTLQSNGIRTNEYSAVTQSVDITPMPSHEQASPQRPLWSVAWSQSQRPKKLKLSG